MAFPQNLGLVQDLRTALALGLAVSLAAALVVTPRAIRKLRGAGIVGRDRQKPGAPEIPEMGGLAVFLAFNVGVFVVLGLADLPEVQQVLVLSALVVAAGALVTGALDDLISLRQRFKAFIPFAFAIPLALYQVDTRIDFPVLGEVQFGLVYSLLLVPLAIASCSNGFNMLEGFNGLGTGLGIILGAGVSILALLHGNLSGLILLFPLLGALAGFMWFNVYPSKVFPGDSMTLLVGAVLGASIILSKVEFWGGLLFLPHVVEFFLKASAGFSVQSFASRIQDGKLVYEGPTHSLTHVVMKAGGRLSEPQIVLRLWAFEALYVTGVIVASTFFLG